jgi:hypothetical protein
MTLVTREGAYPHYGAENNRIFVTRGSGPSGTLVSVDLNGEAAREHASGEMVTTYEVSPDGAYVAFEVNFGAYVMPMAQGPQESGAG